MYIPGLMNKLASCYAWKRVKSESTPEQRASQHHWFVSLRVQTEEAGRTIADPLFVYDFLVTEPRARRPCYFAGMQVNLKMVNPKHQKYKLSAQTLDCQTVFEP